MLSPIPFLFCVSKKDSNQSNQEFIFHPLVFLINVTQKLNQSILLRIWKMRWIRAELRKPREHSRPKSGLSVSPLACSVSYWWLTAPKYTNVPLQLLQTNPHCAVSGFIRELFSFYRNTSADHDCTKICTTKGSCLMAQQDVNIRGVPVLWAVMSQPHAWM